MSNLEHLIENGLCLLDEGKSYREWRELMQQDCNWNGNENITLENLWETCQYVIFTWDSDKKEIVRCKDCIHWDRGYTEECENSNSVYFHNGWCEPDWFCPVGERRTDNE